MASTILSAMLGAKTHAVAGSTKLKATTAGHIYNIEAAADIDNGAIVGKGEFLRPEVYAEAAASATFAGKIIGQAANGNWYVEVTACAAGDCLVLTTPLIYEAYATENQDEANFYNAKGDILRCYELCVGDVFELSTVGFTGTPVVGKAVSVASKKIKVATA